MIAFVYRDAIADSAWIQSHEQARQAVDAEFGARVHTNAAERVASTADSDRAFRDLAARGYKVIFATDPIYSDAAARMATADYDLKIEQAMGAQELINMRVYAIRHRVQSKLARGEFQVFTGPTKTSANAVVLADKGIGDERWRKWMNFLLSSVTVVANS